MMLRLLSVLTLTLLASAGYAACSSPAGVEGVLSYDSTDNVVTFCDGTNWQHTGRAVSSAGTTGCINPTGAEGQIIYNSAYNLPQFCNGDDWVNMGPQNAGAGTTGCTNPTGAEGQLTYNTSASWLQYCNGDNWVNAGLTMVNNWSPAMLFTSGETGVWYDPSDLDTLFQDSTGNVPVTADGDVVGLMLDKSQLGGNSVKAFIAGQTELVTDGGFDVDISNWTTLSGTATLDDGRLKLTSDGAGGNVRSVQNIGALNSGTTVILKADFVKSDANVSNASFLRITSESVGYSNTLAQIVSTENAPTIQLIYTVTEDDDYYIVVGGGNNDGDTTHVDNASVKIIPGNHATQNTAAARPTYQTDGTYHWLEFDGTDDVLNFDGTSIVNTNYMVSIAFTGRTSPSADMVLGGSAGGTNNNMQMGWRDATTLRGGQYNNDILGTSTWAATPLVLTHNLNSTERSLRENGVQLGTKGTTQLSAWSGAAIGGRTLDSSYADADVYGVILLGTEAEPENIIRTESYLATKAGVTLN